MRDNVVCEASEAKTGMQRVHNIVRRDAGALALLLAVLVLCLCAEIAGAQTVPSVVMSQVTTLAKLPNGGALAGTNPAGSSMAVDSAGKSRVKVTATHNGKSKKFEVAARVDTPVEADYYRNGGILPFVLKQLAAR